MRKATASIIFAAAFAATAQAIDGTAATGYGYYNNATNSNYTTTVGYGAGWGAAYDIRSCLFGAVAGRNSGDLLRCQGFGYGALDWASNCTDCVAIGYKVGAGWRNRTGWVDVGGAFVYTNGVAVVKAERGAQIGPLRLDPELKDNRLDGNLTLGDGGSTGNIFGLEATFNTVLAFGLVVMSAGNERFEINVDDQNRLTVTKGGTLLGYLTITPPEE